MPRGSVPCPSRCHKSPCRPSRSASMRSPACSTRPPRSRPPKSSIPRCCRSGGSRLAGIEPPRYEDTEKTIDELKARVAKTLAFVKALDAKQIDAAADREITFPLGPNNKGHMKGDEYLSHFVLPNFYFHLTAAYAILRHCGVEVGKRDFLGAIPLRMT